LVVSTVVAFAVVAVIVVNVPAAGVAPPIMALSTVPPLISTVLTEPPSVMVAPKKVAVPVTVGLAIVGELNRLEIVTYLVSVAFESTTTNRSSIAGAAANSVSSDILAVDMVYSLMICKPPSVNRNALLSVVS
jgi:hypothetical protein